MGAADELRREIADLMKDGAALARGLQDIEDGGEFSHLAYQKWYSRALKAVEILAPDRYEEFRRYYEPDPKRKDLGYGSYVIQDLFRGVAPNEFAYPAFDVVKQASGCVWNQVNLLAGVAARIDSVLSNLQSSLHAELGEAELETARSLLKVSLRAAGAVAGVVLEGHLALVCRAHSLRFRKKHPTLADYNDALRDAGAYATATWRKVSYLADIRNLCTHKKSADPTQDQVVELINGTEWAVGNIS